MFNAVMNVSLLLHKKEGFIYIVNYRYIFRVSLWRLQLLFAREKNEFALGQEKFVQFLFLYFLNLMVAPLNFLVNFLSLEGKCKSSGR